MKKWKWQRRHRPDRDTTRGKTRQMVKAKIRDWIPMEEADLCEGDKFISTEGTGGHHIALAA